MARNFIIVDTEGVDTVKHFDGKAHPETSLFYDFGFMVIDGNDGSVLESHSFINSDVYFRNDLMTSAYYADKRQRYDEGMGIDWTVANTYTIWQTFADACKRHNVRKVWAFNCRYDDLITVNTIQTLSNGFVRAFIPEGVKWADIWDYAGSTLCKTRKYVDWCIRNDYMSDKGNPKTSAEVVARYMLEDDSFIEAHTALEDCKIELAILQAAKRRKQKARHSIGQGWRDAAKIAKA